MRIKTIVTAFALAGCIGGTTATTAQAAATDSVDLTVTGTISLGACTPVFDNGGTVDYGTIATVGLSATDPTDLGVKSTNLTITCTSAQKVAFSVTDNASASAVTAGLGGIAAANAFCLGKTTGGVNLGSYSITLKSVTLDATAGDVLSSVDAGTNWTAAASGGLVDNAGTHLWSAGASGADTVAASATTFVYGIDVDAVLQDSTTLAITDEQTLAGSATFTIQYL